jgi:hypothetical protein
VDWSEEDRRLLAVRLKRLQAEIKALCEVLDVVEERHAGGGSDEAVTPVDPLECC